MTGTPKQHALETSACPSCDTTGRDTWENIGRHPEIGRVFQCQQCDKRTFLYDRTDADAGRGQDYTLAPVPDVLQWQDFEPADA